MPCSVRLLDLRGILHWDLLLVKVVVIAVVHVVVVVAVVEIVVVVESFEEEREEFPAAITVCVERYLPRIDNHLVLLMELVVHEQDQNYCRDSRRMKMMTSRAELVRMWRVAR